LPDGSKEPLHAHNWSAAADVSSSKLNDMGFVMDFHRIKHTLDNIVAEFDNITLENVDYFRQNTSSAENVAKYIYEKLRLALPEDVRLEAVRITEEPGCSAKFASPS
jgi:6-pyruvoyltetrahydropterin/6-carboxytetrahydropterin synthase